MRIASSADRPVNLEAEIPEALRMLRDLQAHADQLGLDRSLRHLVHLRASQLNGCAYCVRLHAREARADGETNARLDHLAVWRRMDDYSPGERAALAWTEALTLLGGDNEARLPSIRAELRAQFSESQIAALTAQVALINHWNRIAISRH